MTEARKRATQKWDRANLTSVGCKVTKEKAAQFRQACSALGVIPNQILLKAVENVIAEAEKLKYNQSEV